MSPDGQIPELRGPVPQFSLLIKPTSADCNLRCRYCFYRHGRSTEPRRMSEKVLTHLIQGYMATDQQQYVFNWQGGEPTLMGVAFFRKVVRLQEEWGSWGATVGNSVQTNGTLIDDEFARLFAEYRFLVGISIDGPPDIHDRYRRHPNGAGSHEAALRGVEVLRRNGVDFNILSLVTDVGAEEGVRVYRYFRQREYRYLQFVPCVEFDDQGRPLVYTVQSEAWGRFLCAVFDEWIKDDVGFVSVRLFDSLLEYLVSGTRNVCQMQPRCSGYLVVEHDGAIYPCDFFVRPEFALGNIARSSWAEVHTGPITSSFTKMKSRWNGRCGRCPHGDYCSGDCLKHRLFHGRARPEQRSWLCNGYRIFFNHAMPRLKRLAANLQKPLDERA